MSIRTIYAAFSSHAARVDARDDAYARRDSRDYALANGIAKATARVQLKSVFRKFDVRSQHQLVAAVLNTLR